MKQINRLFAYNNQMEAFPTCSGAQITEDFCVSFYCLQSTQSLNLTGSFVPVMEKMKNGELQYSL